MSASFESAKPSKDLAITSMVLGIVSIFTLGLLVVGAIISIVLGLIALNKVEQNPRAYAGKKQAIAGITASVVSLVLIVLGTLAAIVVPKLLENIKQGR